MYINVCHSKIFPLRRCGEGESRGLMVPLILMKARIVGQLVWRQQGMGCVGLPVPPQCLKECLYATIYLMTN